MSHEHRRVGARVCARQVGRLTLTTLLLQASLFHYQIPELPHWLQPLPGAADAEANSNN